MEILKDLQQMLESWKSAGYDCIAEEGAYYAALIRSTTSDFASSHEMVEEAEKVFEEAGSGSRVPVNHESIMKYFVIYLQILQVII